MLRSRGVNTESGKLQANAVQSGRKPGGRPGSRLLQSDHEMSNDSGRSKLTVAELASRFRGDMIPLTNVFSYFATVPLGEDELKQYLQEPIAALSPAICAALGRAGVMLVPWLQRGEGSRADLVLFEKPQENRLLGSARAPGDVPVVVLAIRELEVADYHYNFYNALAAQVADNWNPEAQEQFSQLLREELKAEVHGEVDERAWHLKQALVRRQTNMRKETKLFREYARQAFEDTLTLYMHGICCDIDVETGPRQMASRYLRRRLELLQSLYPPPEGYAVFPEQLRKR